MVEEMPPPLFGKYLYKVDIVWCDVIIGTYILCVYTHIYVICMYIYTHYFVYDLK